MAKKSAMITVTGGPNDGDTIGIEQGSCRLIGRHLSEGETALIDRDGNRVLDGSTLRLISTHLQEKPNEVENKHAFVPADIDSFERGPDIVFSDGSISRVHAMIFLDGEGLGIVDLASTNGTLLNSQSVASALVHDGDALSLGKTSFSIKLD